MFCSLAPHFLFITHHNSSQADYCSSRQVIKRDVTHIHLVYCLEEGEGLEVDFFVLRCLSALVPPSTYLYSTHTHKVRRKSASLSKSGCISPARQASLHFWCLCSVWIKCGVEEDKIKGEQILC